MGGAENERHLESIGRLQECLQRELPLVKFDELEDVLADASRLIRATSQMQSPMAGANGELEESWILQRRL